MSVDPQDFIDHTRLSDCCGAPIMGEDICSECKEHCEAYTEDDKPTPPVLGQPGIDGQPPHSVNNPEWVRDCGPKGAPDL